MGSDGNAKLAEQLAALYNCSVKSRNKINQLIAEAKKGLEITVDNKSLSQEMKQAIYQWHLRLIPK